MTTRLTPSDYDVRELREQFRRWANLLRLEGNYVAAQATERQMMNLGAQQGQQLQSNH